MLKTIEGVFREGKVELLECPPNVKEARVIVTFLQDGENGSTLTAEESNELRWRLETWEEDWNAPGMEAYNDV
jgi:hypothetical protein